MPWLRGPWQGRNRSMRIQAWLVFVAAVLVAYVAVAWVGRWWARVSAQHSVARSKGGGSPPPGMAAAKQMTESLYVVAVTDTAVSCTHPDKSVESVAWEDLQSVEITTTDAGPRATDVFWVLHGTTTGCVVPQGATGERQLVARLQELPGFDHAVLIRAMSETGNNRFVCWRRRH